MSSFAPESGELSIEQAVERVGRRLSDAFRAMLVEIPGGPHRAQDLARRLGIKKDLSNRVVRACWARDPLSVLHVMPGPAPLRQFLQAASSQVDALIVQRAEEAVRAFEQLIQERAGDRTSLDAIISEWLPEVREKFESFNKQAVYRGMAQLKGSSAELSVNTAILHPSPDGRTADGVWIAGFVGLRRIRPGSVVHFSSRRFGVGRHALTLEGLPVEGLQGLLLDKFCSTPLPRLHSEKHGRVVHYSLADDAVGPRSAVDLLIAELTPRCMRLYKDGNRSAYGPSAEVSTPCKSLLLDVLVHEDVYPGVDPEVIIMDTAVNGVAELSDESRSIDRLDLVEEVRSLGHGLVNLRVPEIPDYTGIIQHVMDRAGWPMKRFRGYRCKSQYPVYGSQITLAFEAPDPPRS